MRKAPRKASRIAMANAAGGSASCGIVGGRNGCSQRAGAGRCAIPSIRRRLSGWLSAGARDAPWYLLTAEAVTTEEEAWRVVFAYMRRWQIEPTWRYTKVN